MFVLTPTTLSSRHATTLSRAVDHLFAETLRNTPAQARVPALDVLESDTAYTLTLDLPGLTKEQLKVTVEGRRVTLEAGEAKGADAKDATDGQRVLYRERSAAHYARTIALPAEVDQANSNAKFENGVLTLTLAKRVPTGATQISIS